MLRNLGVINKISFSKKTASMLRYGTSKYNFSARLKLSKLKEANKDAFESTSFGIPSIQNKHSNVMSGMNITSSQEIVEAKEVTIGNVPSSSVSHEAETEGMQNYIDNEQTLKNDMQMINYKSKFILI